MRKYLKLVQIDMVLKNVFDPVFLVHSKLFTDKHTQILQHGIVTHHTANWEAKKNSRKKRMIKNRTVLEKTSVGQSQKA